MQKYITIMILICSTNAIGESNSVIIDNASKKTWKEFLSGKENDN